MAYLGAGLSRHPSCSVTPCSALEQRRQSVPGTREWGLPGRPGRVAQPHVAGPVERTQAQAPGAAVRFSTWFLSLSLAT